MLVFFSNIRQKQAKKVIVGSDASKCTSKSLFPLDPSQSETVSEPEIAGYQVLPSTWPGEDLDWMQVNIGGNPSFYKLFPLLITYF